MNALRIFILAGISLSLSACDTKWLPDSNYVLEKVNIFATPTLPCPDVRVLRAGSTFVRYRDGDGRDITDIETEARITDLTFTCGLTEANVVSETPLTTAWNILVELDIQMAVRHGKLSDSSSTVSVPFFVALVDRFGKIVQKQTFLANLDSAVGGEYTSKVHSEEIVLKIPVHDVGEANLYETIVSFQLDQEQIDQM